MLDPYHPVGPGQVVSVTAAGGTDNSFTVDVLLAPHPTITSLSPTRVIPGEPLTITGTNLSNTTAVTVDGRRTQFYSVAATEVVVQLWLSHPDHDDQLLVLTTSDELTAVGLVDVIPLPVPVLVTASPNPVAQGKPLTLQGSNLATAYSVNIGGVQVPVVSASDTSAVVAIPANHPIGTGQIVGVSTHYGFTNSLTVEIVAGIASTPDGVKPGSADSGCASLVQDRPVAWLLAVSGPMVAVLLLRRKRCT
jgi:hypothetical protein